MAEQKNAAQLAAEITALQERLADAERRAGTAELERDSARDEAKAMAQASAILGNGAEETPSGNTRKASICLNPWVTKESMQKFKDIDVPLYFYTVDLPAGAGVELITNGVPFYHGQTYEVDMDTLRDLKSRVARTWDHERAIHSENANAYRKPTAVHLKSAAAIRAGL